MLRFTDSGRTVLATDFGPLGLAWTPRGVARLVVGERDADAVAATLADAAPDVPSSRRPRGPAGEVARRLRAHLRGRPDPLDDVPVDLAGRSPFAVRVLRALRRTPPGRVITYGALARRAGRPSAARAVGAVLRRNPVPLILPCHRCLGADGALTGFSAPGGVALKARLLDREGHVFDPEHEHARRALMARDRVLRRIIPRVGPYLAGLGRALPAWDVLVRSIIHQQLSVKAGRTIRRRVEALAPGPGLPPPADLLVLPDDALRSAGLSRAKTGFLKDLAARVLDGRLDLRALPRLDDEAAIAALVAVKGIGRWSAQMHLMFHLGRLDVLPVADVGLQNAAGLAYGRGRGLTPAELAELGETWRPWRSVASWYLWQAADMGGL